MSYVRPLGSGGFADVYLYEQDLPRRVVAVKVLSGELLDNAAMRAFHAEADVLARLSTHPSVVTVHQASVAPDGRPYLVMEFCPDSLGARAKRAPLGLAEVLDAGVRVASALETAHRSGVLHRDIKPSNILVTTLGSPVLADFGIAAAVTGQVAATVAMSVPWSAPEVLDGRVAGSVASELWSLAATLHTLLAGRAPFEVDDRAKNSRESMTARILRGGPQRIGRDDVPDRVEQILRRGMSQDPARRQPSMLALAEELRWVQYELGWAPTALEVPATDWARGATPVDLDDAAPRGPVVARVGGGGRRAARAARQADHVDRDGLVIAGPARNAARRAAVWGAAGGAVLMAGLAALLHQTGLL
ncbi:MAG: serine/threonine protein kinase [Cellulomonadaceae bacterium]|nr:serine/threonine protein kinase [Cellulomonadaceae bacterium]